MLDLFSGLGGASKAMRERGWRVVTVDVEPRFKPEVVADVCGYRYTGPAIDLLWASPPCTEFSKESMPWTRTGRPPDISLMLATLRIVHEIQPSWWILENVKGAAPYFRRLIGPEKYRSGPVYLWGDLPPGLLPRLSHWKEKLPGRAPEKRAEMPYELSYAVAIAVERWKERKDGIRAGTAPRDGATKPGPDE